MSFQVTRKTTSNARVAWVIPDMVLMYDANLIDGRSNAGKSAVISAILGQWHNDPRHQGRDRLRNILWLSQEEDYDLVIRPRLEQYGIPGDNVITIPYRNGDVPRPLMPAQLTKMVETIKGNDVNAIVIDPFSELKEWDASINDGDAMRLYMGSLCKLCYQTESTIFAPRHMRKANGSYSADDGMGSVQISATVRSVLRVDATEEKLVRRFVSVQSSNMGKPVLPLQFDIEFRDGPYGHVKFLGHKDITVAEIKGLSESKSRRLKLDDAKRLLLEALKDGPVSCKKLIQEAKDNGIGDRTLDEAKAQLDIKSDRKKDAESDTSYWVWTLPDQSQVTLTTGDDQVQLTITDLPEFAQPPLAMLTDPPADPPADPPKAKPSRKFKGKRIPMPKEKPTPKPKKEPKKQPPQK